jgi:hypothetical protein
MIIIMTIYSIEAQTHGPAAGPSIHYVHACKLVSDVTGSATLPVTSLILLRIPIQKCSFCCDRCTSRVAGECDLPVQSSDVSGSSERGFQSLLLLNYREYTAERIGLSAPLL